MRRVGAVILAAGASTRLGEPKQMVMLGQESLLERSIRVAEEAGCSPIVVVLGAFAEEIRKRCKLDRRKVILNEAWNEGMGTSISAAIRSLHDVDGAVVMTCDMPAVTPEHLQALMAREEIAASFYANRRGVPAYFPQSTFPALAQLQGDAGAKELLQFARTVELKGGELDIDTLQDVNRVREIFGGK